MAEYLCDAFQALYDGAQGWAKLANTGDEYIVLLPSGAYVGPAAFEVWSAPADSTGCAPDLTKAAKVPTPAAYCPNQTAPAATDWVITVAANGVAPASTEIGNTNPGYVTARSALKVPVQFCPGRAYLSLKPVGAAANIQGWLVNEVGAL